MEKYRHKQNSSWMIIMVLFIAFLSIFNFTISNFQGAIFLTLAFTVLILASFSSLTVVVDDEFLKIKFGYGIYKKKFLLKDIKSVRKVRNKWYYGWGIRWWNFVRIYNVSGLDAVEIVMQDDKKYRIGTDDVEGLENALNLK